MKINNVSQKTSIRILITIIILNIIALCLFILGYMAHTATSGGTYSVFNFLQWFSSVIFKPGEIEEKFLVLIYFIIIPATLFLSLIGIIRTKYIAIKDFYSKLNVKSVELLADRVNFKFNQPQCDFVCGYSDIESLSMEIETGIHRTRYREYIVIREIILYFKVLNGKTFELHSVNFAPERALFKILKYARNITDFSYKFTGAGESPELKEKITTFQTRNIKLFLTKKGEDNCKYMSIIWFIVNLILLFEYRETIMTDITEGSGIVLLLAVIFFLSSFVFDIILFINKIYNKSVGGHNE